MLLGITVVVAVATVVGSLLADIAYAVLDPRVRYVSHDSASCRRNRPDPDNPSAIAGWPTVTADRRAGAAAAAGMLPAGKPRSTFRRGLEVFLENKLAVTGVAHLRVHAAVLLPRAAASTTPTRCT